MLLPLSLLGCYHDAVTSTEAEVVPPAPAPVADRVEKDADVIAILGGALERGACRDGKVRVEGHVVIDAADPTHRDLLIARLGSESLAAAAVAASLLWDARTPLDGSHADAIGHTLLALHQASVDDVQVLHCRSLKAVQGDGILWNARGDALALLAAVDDREAATRALQAVQAEVPLLDDPGKAAFGDADAIHRISKESLRQLCAGRTWETTWMMRTLDIGKKNGSLLPLGQLSTGACELLAEGVDPDVVTPRQ